MSTANPAHRAAASPQAPSPYPILELIKLHKRFGDHVVLEAVDLRIEPGELVCVIGPSGSGKSTMLRLCNQLERACGGQVIFDGQDLTSSLVSIDRVRRQIGMVFQQFNLYPHLRALGNVTLALRRVAGLPRREAQAIALDALERVGMREHANAWPSTLSGGQQQRVAIARAIAMSPKIVLFDEPTSALDPTLVGSVLAVMRRLREEGMTMLVVTHEMQFARAVADRVVFMADGKVIEQGPPEQLFTTPRDPRTAAFINGESN